jgi:acyl carrier protein
MDTLPEFTKQLESEFEDFEPGTLTPQTNYRELKGWSSMHALIVIAFVDANYNVLLTGADLKNAQTVEDLFTIVKERQ